MKKGEPKKKYAVKIECEQTASPLPFNDIPDSESDSNGTASEINVRSVIKKYATAAVRGFSAKAAALEDLTHKLTMESSLCMMILIITMNS